MPGLAARPAGSRQRKPCWTGVPEVYFTKHVDNSRVVKVDDPQRSREMRTFCIALACFCLLVLSYAWQHFKSIEYGYRIAELKVQRDNLQESNRALHLEEASLRSPDRIDKIAREMGMLSPQPGQVQLLDTAASDDRGPVMASAAPVSVISVR
ncbi:MAG TPA: cell division protein FtsL [Terriglobales bacterium]|jgi:cell division protein FtsL